MVNKSFLRGIVMVIIPLLFPTHLIGEIDIEGLSNDIYYCLVEELGQSVNPDLKPPELDFSDGQSQGAKYFQKRNEIIIEKPLCSLFVEKLGVDAKAAIAMILGHELGHYIYQTECAHEFGYIEHLTIDPDNPSVMGDKELKADFLGGFLGYMAGYKTLHMYHEVFNLLYDEYGIGDNNKDYPPKDLRIKVAGAVDFELEKMINAFEVGQKLIVTEHYQEAIICYKAILKEFKGKEFHNNIAVACLLGAVDNSKPQDVNYIFPFEIDTQSRLRFDVRKPPKFNQKMRDSFLLQAKTSLGVALKIDPYYLSARINLASVYLLEGDIEKANKIMEEYTQFSPFSPQYTNYFESKSLIKGIGYAMSGERDLAREEFISMKKTAKKVFIDMANMNLKAINGEPILNSSQDDPPDVDESVDNIDLFHPEGLGKDFSISLAKGKNLSVTKYPNSRVFNYANEIYFQQMNRDMKTRMGYGQGDSIDLLIKCGEYGTKPQIIQTKNGGAYLFKQSRLIFWVDSKKKIKKWDLYND